MSLVMMRRLMGVVAIVVVLGLTVLASLGLVGRIAAVFDFVPGQDGTRHFIAMGLLSAGVNLGFAGVRVGGRRLGVAWLTGLVLVGITLEEYSQAYIPGRSLSMEDWGAGCLGVLLAAGLVAPLVRRWRRNAGAG